MKKVIRSLVMAILSALLLVPALGEEPAARLPV